MAKTATLTVRLDPKVKTDAQDVFTRLGLTTTQAVSLFLNQVSLHKGLPFDLHIPNEETEKAVDEALTRRNLLESKNLVDLTARLQD